MGEMAGRRCGAVAGTDGSVRWRVWAPNARRVDLVLVRPDGGRDVRSMRAEPPGNTSGGYFHHTEPDVPDGQRYAYRLDGGDDRPDPCSLWQPKGVPGPSAVFRPASFRWTDAGWNGVSREDLVLYELHVGTFTPEGTFEAVIPRLAALKELGVTAIEIMPVNQFPGARNWGYDGVLPYAIQNTYGGPQGLQKLVDACHAHGIAAILDVVYNHVGPEGNYLGAFGPYFTDKYKTPWGKAVNYDDRGSDAVRDWVLDNVRMWLTEFHFDGLRLDAVHAIYDIGARHILRAIRDVADEAAAQSARATHVIAESDQNDPRVLHAPSRGGHGMDAQWSDDFHHAVHAHLTGERRGYYSDYGGARQVARALETPFLFAWEYSPHRGRKHGAPPEGLGGDRFVVCIQNHDQVGNRARGDRISTLVENPAKQRLAASLLLLSPHLPLLFMGEEYGETRPFPFFCDFHGEELTQAVREGRKREFAELVGGGEQVPDPASAGTFESAKLTWQWPEGTAHGGIRRMYRDLLAARKAWPAMRDFVNRTARLVERGGAGVIEFVRGTDAGASAGRLRAYFNLTDAAAPLPAPPGGAEAVLFSSEASAYRGARGGLEGVKELLPFECLAIGPADWKPLS